MECLQVDSLLPPLRLHLPAEHAEPSRDKCQYKKASTEDTAAKQPDTEESVFILSLTRL